MRRVSGIVLTGMSFFALHAYGVSPTPTPIWIFSVGKDSNKVIGVSRIQKSGPQVMQVRFGKGLGNAIEVDLSLSTLTFPSKTNPVGRYKVFQAMIHGNQTKLYFFEAPRVEKMNQFDSCLLRAESKQPAFQGIDQLKKSMQTLVSGRTPEVLKAGWSQSEVAKARQTLEAMAAEWESMTTTLSAVEIGTKQDCLTPSQFEAALRKNPRLTHFELEAKSWDRVEEEFPVLPVSAMTEYIGYWSTRQNELPEFFFSRVFDGPFGTVKTRLISLWDEKYEADGRSTPAQAIRAEFKLGILSLLAKPIFEFWLGKDSHQLLYSTGNPGFGEGFESFVLR